VASPAAVAAFVHIEARAVSPLLPLRYLRRRNFSVPIVVQVFVNFAYMGSFVLTPLFLDEVFGYGETKTGTLVIARPLAFAIAGPVAGSLTVKVGERFAAIAGSLFVFASMVSMSLIGVGSADVVILGALALAGVGLGMSAPALSVAIANSVDDDDLGVAGATQQMMSQFGVVLGVQLMVSTQASRSGVVGEANAFSEAYLVGAAAAVVAVCVSLFVRSTPQEDFVNDPPAAVLRQ
jgi:MFS family permease